jgi:hypothetical protein
VINVLVGLIGGLIDWGNRQAGALREYCLRSESQACVNNKAAKVWVEHEREGARQGRYKSLRLWDFPILIMVRRRRPGSSWWQPASHETYTKRGGAPTTIAGRRWCDGPSEACPGPLLLGRHDGKHEFLETLRLWQEGPWWASDLHHVKSLWVGLRSRNQCLSRARTLRCVTELRMSE